MLNLSLGLTLQRGGGGAGGPVIITVAGAGTAPASEALTEGDLVSSVANFATIDSTSNFESSAGTISTVEWISGGSDRAGSYALPAGSSLVVRVTDSAANVRDWTIDSSVAYAAITLSSAATSSGDPVIGESLTGTQATFGGGTIVTETHEWESSPDNSVWTGTGDTDTTSPPQVSGGYLRLTSTASNPTNAVTSSSAAIGPAVAPVLTINGLTGGVAEIGAHASISGSADQGTVVSEKWGTVAGDATYGTGTNPTDFTAGDGGNLVWSPTVGGVEYSESAPIQYAAAVNTVAPTVTGLTSLGEELSTDNGTWTGATGGSYSYQWQRGGVDISGATASTYTIVVADDAAQVRCVVTYTNTGGPVSANSNAVTIDDFTIPVISGVPTISGTEQEGSTLTATPASVTGNPAPTRELQWVCDGSPIPSAVNTTYTLQGTDVGCRITVIQTEENEIGVDIAESAETGIVTELDDTAPTINGFTVAQSGNNVEFTIQVAAGEDSYFAYVVGVPNGEGQPSVAQIKAGQDSTGANAEFWIDGYEFATDLVDVAVAMDRVSEVNQTIDWYLVVADDVPNNSTISSDLAVPIDTTVSTPQTSDLLDESGDLLTDESGNGLRQESVLTTELTDESGERLIDDSSNTISQEAA